MWQLLEPLINSVQYITNSVNSIVFTSSHLLQAYEQFRWKWATAIYSQVKWAIGSSSRRLFILHASISSSVGALASYILLNGRLRSSIASSSSARRWLSSSFFNACKHLQKHLNKTSDFHLPEQTAKHSCTNISFESWQALICCFILHHRRTHSCSFPKCRFITQQHVWLYVPTQPVLSAGITWAKSILVLCQTQHFCMCRDFTLYLSNKASKETWHTEYMQNLAP